MTLATLREEQAVAGMISTFVQHDADLAAAFLLKLETFAATLERSDFFATHCFLRTTLLFVYDDAARRAKVELKITNVGQSYALPDGVRIRHVDAWDGTPDCHEDGYMVGVQSLIRIMNDIATPRHT